MSLITGSINVIRQLPHGSAIDIPWQWMESHELTSASIIMPKFDLTSEPVLRQTGARIFFAVILPSIAKPFGLANLGLGVVHFVWCICNINKIRKREPGYSGEEMENALIRIAAGLYDLAIGYIFCSAWMGMIYGQWTIPLLFALLPTYAIQLHHLVFEKATKTIAIPDGKTALVDPKAPPKIEVDHRALKVGCLIKQFCNGLIQTFIPEPEKKLGLGGRLWAFPAAIGTFATATWGKVWVSPPAEQKAQNS